MPDSGLVVVLEDPSHVDGTLDVDALDAEGDATLDSDEGVKVLPVVDVVTSGGVEVDDVMVR